MSSGESGGQSGQNLDAPHPAPRSRRSRTISRAAIIIANKKSKDGDKGTGSRGRSSSAGRKDPDELSRAVGDCEQQNAEVTFQRNFSLRQRVKRQPSKQIIQKNLNATNVIDNSMELSTEESSPGVLKVFGDRICPGATYKSVLATGGSTSAELVKEALERYGIPRRKAAMYVLCEVIGAYQQEKTGKKHKKKKKESKHGDKNADDGKDGKWMEECVRVIGDQERPLVLLSYWKPPAGLQRRFELRLKKDVQDCFLQDTTTSGINANAKKMLRSKAAANFKHQLIPPEQEADEHHSSDGHSDDNATDSASTIDIGPSSLIASGFSNRAGSQSSSRSQTLSLSSSDSTASARLSVATAVADSNKTSCSSRLSSVSTHSSQDRTSSSGQPYLLRLSAYDEELDTEVMHIIRQRTTLIGSEPSHLSVDEGDICLTAPDILPSHCWLYREGSKIEIEPIPKGIVRVNKQQVLHKQELLPDQLVDIGESYMFLCKIPGTAAATAGSGEKTQSLTDSSLDLIEVLSSVISAKQKADDEELDAPAVGLPNQLSVAEEWRKRKNHEYEQDHSRMKLSFSRDKSDELLCLILSASSREQQLHPLAQSYLMVMMLEYSAAKYDQNYTRSLLVDMSNHMQSHVVKITKHLSDQLDETPVQEFPSIDALLHALREMIRAMSNSLQIYIVLKNNMESFLLPVTSESASCPEREVVEKVKDIVTHTFQRTVYYITKSLFNSVFALLDTQGESQTPEVIDLYTQTLQCLQHHRLHKQVTSHVFAYLFYFTSTSLFNEILTKGSDYLSWSSGIQIRNTLDDLSVWSEANDLHSEEMTFMNKINTLVDLIAKPKLQLLKTSWSSLREGYPSLSEEQLCYVLHHYQLPRAMTRPDAWGHPRHVQLLHYSELFEGFKNHPPFELPESSSLVDLSREVTELSFRMLHSKIVADFCVGEDDRDSGFSMDNGLLPKLPTSPFQQSQQFYIPQPAMEKPYAASHLDGSSVADGRKVAPLYGVGEAVSNGGRNCGAHGMRSSGATSVLYGYGAEVEDGYVGQELYGGAREKGVGNVVHGVQNSEEVSAAVTEEHQTLPHRSELYRVSSDGAIEQPESQDRSTDRSMTDTKQMSVQPHKPSIATKPDRSTSSRTNRSRRLSSDEILQSDQLVETSIDIQNPVVEAGGEVAFKLSLDNVVEALSSDESSMQEHTESSNESSPRYGPEMISHMYNRMDGHGSAASGRFRKNNNKSSLDKTKHRMNRLSKSFVDESVKCNRQVSDGEPDDSQLEGENEQEDEHTYVNLPFISENCPDWSDGDRLAADIRPPVAEKPANLGGHIPKATQQCRGVLKKRFSSQKYTQDITQDKQQQQKKKSVTIQDEVDVYPLSEALTAQQLTEQSEHDDSKTSQCDDISTALRIDTEQPVHTIPNPHSSSQPTSSKVYGTPSPDSCNNKPQQSPSPSNVSSTSREDGGIVRKRSSLYLNVNGDKISPSSKPAEVLGIEKSSTKPAQVLSINSPGSKPAQVLGIENLSTKPAQVLGISNIASEDSKIPGNNSGNRINRNSKPAQVLGISSTSDEAVYNRLYYEQDARMRSRYRAADTADAAADDYDEIGDADEDDLISDESALSMRADRFSLISDISEAGTPPREGSPSDMFTRIDVIEDGTLYIPGTFTCDNNGDNSSHNYNYNNNNNRTEDISDPCNEQEDVKKMGGLSEHLQASQGESDSSSSKSEHAHDTAPELCNHTHENSNDTAGDTQIHHLDTREEDTHSLDNVSSVNDSGTNTPDDNKGNSDDNDVDDDDVDGDNVHVSPAMSRLMFTSRITEYDDNVFSVELHNSSTGLGMEFVDGMTTSLHQPGIYICRLAPDLPAAEHPHIRLGDRILTVNGTSVVGAAYQKAMDLIKCGGEILRFMISRSSPDVAAKLTATNC